MKLIFLLIFITSCTSPSTVNKNNFQNFDFNENLSFNSFKQLLVEYAETNPYPNIDE